jgi:hypothetical protein
MTATATVNAAPSPQHSSERPRGGSSAAFYKSGGVIALFVFVTLFVVLGVVLPGIRNVASPGHKATVDVWCKRFERFLVSSADPDVLMIGSSLILVSSQACDMKFAGLELPYDGASWTRITEGYLSPRYFLSCLSQEGRGDLSVVNLGIPSAVIRDNLLLTKESLDFGKRPKLVIFAIAPRDFIINASKDKKTPVEEVVGDINMPLTDFSSWPALRWSAVRLRPYSVAQAWDDERYYFRHELTELPAFVKQIVLTGGLQPTQSSAQHKPLSVLDDLLFQTDKKLDFRQMTDCYTHVDQNFFNRQFTALEESAKLLKKNGIRLMLVEMPLPAGNLAALPPSLSSMYFGRIKTICQENGLPFYRPELEETFPDRDFQDDSHLNAFGAAKFFKRLAHFVAQPK